MDQMLMAGSTSISTSSCDVATETEDLSERIVFTKIFESGNPSGVRSWYARAPGESAVSRKTTAQASFRNPVERTSLHGVPQTGATHWSTNFWRAASSLSRSRPSGVFAWLKQAIVGI